MQLTAARKPLSGDMDAAAAPVVHALPNAIEGSVKVPSQAPEPVS